MNATLEPSADTAAREIIQKRTLKAPPALVWELLTNPKHLIVWWGPNGYTNTFEHCDIREGGEWRFMMHGPDGKDWPNRIQYTEVRKPELLAYVHGDLEDPKFKVRIELKDNGDGTTGFTMRSLFPTVEACNTVKSFGAVELGAQTVDKLENEIATMLGLPPVDSLFKLSRTFDAPRQLVWDAFTKPEHLQHWWGPVGMDVKVHSFTLRPGGLFHYSMTTPDGNTMYGRFFYREIVEPSMIVFINSFADAEGNIVPMPYLQPFPAEVLNSWLFEEKDGKTILTMRGGALKATPEEREAYEKLKPSMEQGFGGTFQQLDEYLVKIK